MEVQMQANQDRYDPRANGGEVPMPEPPGVETQEQPRSHPSGGKGVATAGGGTGTVPRGGAIGPGPAQERRPEH